MDNNKKMDTKELEAQKNIDGRPTKELFITMLVRDISLTDAISDLVDNCVDGAIRLKEKKKFNGLEVDITVNGDCFKIKDNCGGIDKELAQKYAFRFGRPEKTPQVKYSVGQFGIGMKRALFKMGNNFEIKSTSPKSSFVVEIDVDKWGIDPDKWDFEFKNIEDKINPIAACGTEIRVTALRREIKERFQQGKFLIELKRKLELQHLNNISRGLVIKINGDPIEAMQLKLLDTPFKTAYWEKNFKSYHMNVKIYAGIGKDDLKMGGWYIFCNNRLIEGPEQTELTGWVGGKKAIPKYHVQFNRFRGFVFFEAKYPVVLPWNTSKNTVDIDSPIFHNIKPEMTALMRPVINFLNDVHTESTNVVSGKIPEKYLQNKIDRAKLKDYLDVKTSATFVAPKQKQKVKKTDEVKITYSKSTAKVEEIKKVLKVSSNKEVGEKTFEYVYERECKE